MSNGRGTVSEFIQVTKLSHRYSRQRHKAFVLTSFMGNLFNLFFCCDMRTHADGGGSLVVFHLAVKPPNRR